jgi:hypothetical protein
MSLITYSKSRITSAGPPSLIISHSRFPRTKQSVFSELFETHFWDNQKIACCWVCLFSLFSFSGVYTTMIIPFSSVIVGYISFPDENNRHSLFRHTQVSQWSWLYLPLHIYYSFLSIDHLSPAKTTSRHEPWKIPLSHLIKYSGWQMGIPVMGWDNDPQ